MPMFDIHSGLWCIDRYLENVNWSNKEFFAIRVICADIGNNQPHRLFSDCHALLAKCLKRLYDVPPSQYALKNLALFLPFSVEDEKSLIRIVADLPNPPTVFCSSASLFQAPEDFGNLKRVYFYKSARSPKFPIESSRSVIDTGLFEEFGNSANWVPTIKERPKDILDIAIELLQSFKSGEPFPSDFQSKTSLGRIAIILRGRRLSLKFKSQAFSIIMMASKRRDNIWSWLPKDVIRLIFQRVEPFSWMHHTVRIPKWAKQVVQSFKIYAAMEKDMKSKQRILQRMVEEHEEDLERIAAYPEKRAKIENQLEQAKQLVDSRRESISAFIAAAEEKLSTNI